MNRKHIAILFVLLSLSVKLLSQSMSVLEVCNVTNPGHSSCYLSISLISLTYPLAIHGGHSYRNPNAQLRISVVETQVSTTEGTEGSDDNTNYSYAMGIQGIQYGRRISSTPTQIFWTWNLSITEYENVYEYSGDGSEGGWVTAYISHNQSGGDDHDDDVELGYYGFYVEPDSSSPTIPVLAPKPDPQKPYKSVDVYASGSIDSGSGLSHYEYSVDGINWKDCEKDTENDGCRETATINVKGDIAFRAVDGVGNIGPVRLINIDIDNDPPAPPTFSLLPESWTNASVTIYASSKDTDNTDITLFAYSTDMLTWQERNAGQGFDVAGNGVVYAKAIDKAKNESSVSSITITRIDTKRPALSGSPSVSLGSDGATIIVEWTATDYGESGWDASGIENSLVQYSSGGEYKAAQASVSNIDDHYTAAVPISDDMLGKDCLFTVTEVDRAGNSSEPRTSLAFAVPPILPMTSVIIFPEGLKDQTDQDRMEVDIELDCDPAIVRSSFSELRIARTRSSGAGGTATLPDLVIDTQTISIDGDGNLVPSATWKLSANNRLCYIDNVPVSSGAGNKTWTYTLTPYVGAGKIPWVVSAGQARDVRMPNNRGSLDRFVVKDAQGHESGTSDFNVGPTGTVFLEIRGSDPDQDDWLVNVDRVTRIRQENYEFTSRSSLSGKSPLSYAYAGGYADLAIPLTLSYGDNNIQLAWTEGGAENPVFSETKDLVLTRDIGGAYRLAVFDRYGNEVSGTGDGIICAPGQILDFTVSGEDALGIAWDFGDGSPAAAGPAQSHAYHQDAAQTACSIVRTLSLSLPSSTVVPIQVTVMDTRQGELYESETWRGDHTIVGKVIVPTGMDLRIASGAIVSFQGDIGAGYRQGILVKGGLEIGGGSTLRAADGQVKRWDAILVEGTAAIGDLGGSPTDIRDAERAVAAAPGSNVSLRNVRLTADETGLHVVGAASVVVDGCEITGNALYGIKEDAGGRPAVRNTAIRGNSRNYYKWDGGLLTIGQVNAIAGNSGNQGE
jgi:hypothetical protein